MLFYGVGSRTSRAQNSSLVRIGLNTLMNGVLLGRVVALTFLGRFDKNSRGQKSLIGLGFSSPSSGTQHAFPCFRIRRPKWGTSVSNAHTASRGVLGSVVNPCRQSP